MLVLTRNLKEKIIINNNIEVVVLKIRGKQVRLGIVAPHEIPIFRQEITPFNSKKTRYKVDKPTQSHS